MRFDRNMTLDEIGLAFGVSRERIRQIISKHTPDGGTGYVPPKYTIICKQCGTTVEVPSYKKNYKFCGRPCRHEYKKNRCRKCGTKDNIAPRGFICRPCHNKRQIEYYKTPSGVAAVKRTVTKNIDKIKAYQSEYNKRPEVVARRHTPEFRAKHRAYCRLQYSRDPAKHRERHRIYRLRRKQRLLSQCTPTKNI